MTFEVGKTYKVKIYGSKPCKIHVLSIVDEGMIVFKWYGKTAQWNYNVMHPDALAIRCSEK